MFVVVWFIMRPRNTENTCFTRVQGVFRLFFADESDEKSEHKTYNNCCPVLLFKRRNSLNCHLSIGIDNSFVQFMFACKHDIIL